MGRTGTPASKNISSGKRPLLQPTPRSNQKMTRPSWDSFRQSRLLRGIIIILLVAAALLVIGFVSVRAHRSLTASKVTSSKNILNLNKWAGADNASTNNRARSMSDSSSVSFLDFRSATPATFKPKEKLVGLRYVESEAEVSALSLPKDKVVLKKMLPQKSRVIPKGAFVTMDFVEDRLNVYIDEKSMIINAKWG